ncbi:MAG: HlyD family efflux transporter periplasmic adaptor subunit [Flavobacteriaceae bacterium]|nr:HlyD family efflux transporter periplasmic adaptor subunit [Flavobacteriaceae bacterium]
MDKKIEKKKGLPWKKIVYGLVAICLLGLVAMVATSKSSFRVEKNRVTIKSVRFDKFEDMALFNGQVQPLKTIQINAVESGTIKKIHTENGKIVEEGDVLLELYNPNTELNYLTRETAMIEQINNLRNTRIAIKNQQMNLDRDMIKLSYEYNNAERQYRLDTTLYRKGVIAKNDFLKSEETFKFQTAQSNSTKENVKREQADRKRQLQLINASIQRMQQSLEHLRSNKENFIIKAPASGLLSSYKPVLGESVQTGSLLGKIDMLDGYKIVAKADEYYYNTLQEGQEAIVEFNGKSSRMIVQRIIAEVINGKFDVELVFEKEAPKGIRRGMNVAVKIYQSNQQKKALMLPKGGFYSSFGGRYVFVLTASNKAEKRSIIIGRSNPYYYEVIEGLKEGDKIITSSYDNYKDKEIIEFK